MKGHRARSRLLHQQHLPAIRRHMSYPLTIITLRATGRTRGHAATAAREAFRSPRKATGHQRVKPCWPMARWLFHGEQLSPAAPSAALQVPLPQRRQRCAARSTAPRRPPVPGLPAPGGRPPRSCGYRSPVLRGCRDHPASEAPIPGLGGGGSGEGEGCSRTAPQRPGAGPLPMRRT